jgi:hypothetical protein
MPNGDDGTPGRVAAACDTGDEVVRSLILTCSALGAASLSLPARGDTGLFEGAWKSQHLARKLTGVTFTLGGEGLISEEFLVGGRNNTFSVGTAEYVLQLKSRSPRLVGT